MLSFMEGIGYMCAGPLCSMLHHVTLGDSTDGYAVLFYLGFGTSVCSALCTFLNKYFLDRSKGKQLLSVPKILKQTKVYTINDDSL